MREHQPPLRLSRAGIDTYQQPVVYLHRDCPVVRSEGFRARSRVEIHTGGRTLVATLNVVTTDQLDLHAAALSEVAWLALDPGEGAMAQVRHAEPAVSTSALRAKVFGQRLSADEMREIMRDTVDSRLSDIELAAFVAACAGDRLDLAETVALTRAMVDVGNASTGAPVRRSTNTASAGCRATARRRCSLPSSPRRPSHSEDLLARDHLARGHGGHDGSRGARRPGPARDATCVEREGGCIVWGGSVRLSPADDVLIRIERPLELDSEGQLVASASTEDIGFKKHFQISQSLFESPMSSMTQLSNTAPTTGTLSPQGMA